jgi:hypothetical protein
MIGTRPENTWVVIDEIQKIPALLDEVHRLMEKKGWKVAHLPESSDAEVLTFWAAVQLPETLIPFPSGN